LGQIFASIVGWASVISAPHAGSQMVGLQNSAQSVAAVLKFKKRSERPQKAKTRMEWKPSVLLMWQSGGC
jgi:hypothetical protein